MGIQPSNNHERFSPQPVLQESKKLPMVSRIRPIQTSDNDDFQGMSKAQGLGARPGDGELLAYGYNSQGRLLPDTMILIR
jgi:hypothetical protein